MAKKLRSDQISFGGTAAQFIKGDGSVDPNTYAPLNSVPLQALLGGGSNSVRALDTRNSNPLPSTDLRFGTWFDFKSNSAIGLAAGAAYSAVMTFVPYNDNSGNVNTAFRLAQSANEMYFQNYSAAGTWGSFNRLIHTNNMNSLLWSKAVSGNYTGISAPAPFSVLNANQAQNVYCGGLLASSQYADSQYLPPNGIYSKNTIKTGSHGDSSQWYSAFTQMSNFYTQNEALNLFVGKNGVETISDTKTFTHSPVIPNGTLNGHAINIGQANANYALRDGTNATSIWRNGSYGLISNPTIPDHIKNASGDSDLINATYGDVMGMINSPGTNLGNPTSDWYHRIKMLHQNSAGYYTEIAVQMTGGNSLWFRRFEEGAFIGPNNGWVKVATAEELNTAVNGFVKVNESFSSIIGNDVALVDAFFSVEMGLADIVGGINIAAKVFEAYEYGTIGGGGRINCGIVIDPITTNHGYAARPDPNEKHYFSGRVYSTEGFKTPTNSGSVLLSTDGGQVAAGDSITINSGVIDLSVYNKVVTGPYPIPTVIPKFAYITYSGSTLNDTITLPSTAVEGTRVEIMNVSDVTIKVANGTSSLNLPPSKGIILIHNSIGWLKFGVNDVKYF